jgi:ribosome recycling factor
MEDIDFYLEHAQDSMDKTVAHTAKEFSKIRAGKASPNMVDSLEVAYYGSQAPLNQVASVTAPDARTIAIKPWEKSMIQEIERAIINSDLGLNPQNDGELIRINIPPLTEERRASLVKQVKNEAEQGKISLRNIRKETNDSLKKLLKEEGISEDLIKDAEDEVQKITDVHVKKIDDLTEAKEKDIMTI